MREQNAVAGRVREGVEANARPLEKAGRRLLARLRIVQRHQKHAHMEQREKAGDELEFGRHD